MRRRHPNDSTIHAIMDGPRDLEDAYLKLVEAGIPAEQMTLVLDEGTATEDFPLERTQAEKGAVAGGVLGGTVGGVIGGLAALSAAVPAAAVLGPTVALGLAGGFFGGLVGHALPTDDSKRLHDALRSGRALLAIHVDGEIERALALGILENFHGDALDGEPVTSI